MIKNPVLSNTLSDLSGTAFLQKGLNLVVALILIAGVIYFFFTLISGAIGWISSSGDKTKLEGAQKQITHAFMGLAILLASFAIIKLIETLFGISILNFNVPTL